MFGLYSLGLSKLLVERKSCRTKEAVLGACRARVWESNPLPLGMKPDDLPPDQVRQFFVPTFGTQPYTTPPDFWCFCFSSRSLTLLVVCFLVLVFAFGCSFCFLLLQLRRDFHPIFRVFLGGLPTLLGLYDGSVFREISFTASRQGRT